MGSFSIWHWLILGAVVLLVFGGRGKISDIMGDVAKGIKSFKKGLADDDPKPAGSSETSQSPDLAPVWRQTRSPTPTRPAERAQRGLSTRATAPRRNSCSNSTPANSSSSASWR